MIFRFFFYEALAWLSDSVGIRSVLLLFTVANKIFLAFSCGPPVAQSSLMVCFFSSVYCRSQVYNKKHQQKHQGMLKDVLA
jgi:hypothetical protein